MADRFYSPQGEQYGMPARHISHQSFDDILSELGDDPAIPDPHGIRKPSSPQRALPEPKIQTKQIGLQSIWLNFSQQKSIVLIIQSAIFLCLLGVFFIGLDAHKNEIGLEIKGLQEQLLKLNTELLRHQEILDQDLDDLYSSLNEIEVSVHSNNKNPAISLKQHLPVATPYEADLRRWRYLGLIKMNGLEQALFHTGKSTLMAAKEGVLLGDWRLVHAQKEMATVAHPLGKSIAFKSARSEWCPNYLRQF